MDEVWRSVTEGSKGRPEGGSAGHPARFKTLEILALATFAKN
jgi:hypothetical protein